MPADLVKVGRPAHEPELHGIAYLVRGLPRDFIVYTNTWLAERSGAIYELDAVVVAPIAQLGFVLTAILSVWLLGERLTASRLAALGLAVGAVASLAGA